MDVSLSGRRPSTPRRFFARLYGEGASPPPPSAPSSFLFSDWCSFQSDHKPFVNRTRRKELRPRRQRTTFTSEQTADLETEFQQSEYVSRAQRKSLAQRLSLSETQVKIWFQNRRAKDKRIEKAFLDNQYSRNLALITTSTVSVGFSSMMQQIPCPFCYTLRQDTNVFYTPSLIKEKFHHRFTSESPCCSLEASKCSNREAVAENHEFIT